MTTEVERWKGLCRKVAGALDRSSAEYEESQRELVYARNELASKCAEVDGLEWRVEELEAENAKLRELVKALDWCTENFDIRDKCDQCPLRQRSALDPECEAIMRELGMKGSDA